MELNFLGIGSCFTNNHTSAFFIPDDETLVLIDCSIHAFDRFLEENFSVFKNVYVYITHTHADHVSGLAPLIHYAHYCTNQIITVVAPSNAVAQDIKFLLKLQGVDVSLYTLTVAFDFITALITKNHPVIPEKAFAFCVPTKHVPALEEKCFGYVFNINGKKVIYTGDTASLNSFIPFLKNASELYVDTSCRYESDVHLWLPSSLPLLKQISTQGVKVYLMHLDDVKLAKKSIKGIPNIEVAKVYC